MKTKLKSFYINYEMFEGEPDYMFVLMAKNKKEAEKMATKIIKQDYPDNYYINKDIWAEEVNAEELLKTMTLN